MKKQEKHLDIVFYVLCREVLAQEFAYMHKQALESKNAESHR